MDSGLFASATGMLVGFNVENDISNNLANMQTVGYKARTAVEESFSQLLASTAGQGGAGVTLGQSSIGSLGQAPRITDYGLNLAQGSPRYTGAPLDMMLVGNGFFSVRAGNQTLLTRNGNFHRSAAGQLVTTEGYPVLSSAGRPLTLPPGQVHIDRTGAIAVNGTPVGQVALAGVQVGQPLTQVDGGYYVAPARLASLAAGSTAVAQNYLESSNVDISTQMSAMMSAQRAYQANSRMLQMQDDSLALAVNDLGKVGT